MFSWKKFTAQVLAFSCLQFLSRPTGGSSVPQNPSSGRWKTHDGLWNTFTASVSLKTRLQSHENSPDKLTQHMLWVFERWVCLKSPVNKIWYSALAYISVELCATIYDCRPMRLFLCVCVCVAAGASVWWVGQRSIWILMMLKMILCVLQPVILTQALHKSSYKPIVKSIPNCNLSADALHASHTHLTA